jgi:hypothetical protein
MKEILRKIILYVAFIALATTIIEVLSFNAINALWSPLGFIVYGVFYILFIDFLFRKKITNWGTIYLFGVLVGFLTEAYFAKVIFFGWNNASLIFQGFAIKETALLVTFFHPVFAFIIPVFIAKNFFNFPFAIKESKRKWLIFLLPLYPLVQTMTKNIMIDPPVLIAFLISTIILFVALTLLYFAGKSQNVILSTKSRIFWILFTIAFYILAYFKIGAFGDRPVMHPTLIPLIISFIFVALIFTLIYRRAKNTKEITLLKYEANFSLKKIIKYFVYLYLTLMILLAIISPLIPLRTLVMTIFLIGGTILGIGYFIYTIITSLMGVKNA